MLALQQNTTPLTGGDDADGKKGEAGDDCYSSSDDRAKMAVDKTRVFLDQEREKAVMKQQKRRASMTAAVELAMAPTPMIQEGYGVPGLHVPSSPGGGPPMQGSLTKGRSRRASMGAGLASGPGPSMGSNPYGYGNASSSRAPQQGDMLGMVMAPPDDGDGYGTDSEAKPSRRSQARRASLTMKKEQKEVFGQPTRKGRRASMSEAAPPFDVMNGFHASYSGGFDMGGTDMLYPQQHLQAQLLTMKTGGGGGRRASLSGAMPQYQQVQVMSGKAARRMSNQMQAAAVGGATRRGSMNGAGGKQNRRGSAAGVGVRRMSASGGVEVLVVPVVVDRKRGINPEALARMTARMQNSAANLVFDNDDDDDDEDYGYEYDDAARYGYGDAGGAQYGYNAPVYGGPTPGGVVGAGDHHHRRFERRDSNRSHASRASAASSRSRRRNSCLIRKEIDQRMLAEILADGPPRVSDSEMAESSGEDNDGNKVYGLGYDSGLDSGLDSESEHNNMNFSCDMSTSCNRRNSCVVGTGDDALIDAMIGGRDHELLSSGVGFDLDDDDEDFEDDEPYHKPMNRTMGTDPVLADSTSNLQPKQLSQSQHQAQTDESRVSASKLSGPQKAEEIKKTQSLSGAATSARSTPSWARSTPFTTSHETLNKDSLLSEKQIAHHAVDTMIPGYSIRNNWGEMGFDSESSDDSDSEESFGASMYETPTSAYQEIDRYKQRPQQIEELKKSWYHIGDIIKEAEKDKSKKIPDFKPATGCNNAADFIVRCFCARLRQGITVVKHNRSRWSKSQLRILYLLPDGRTLSWKAIEGEDKGKRPKLDLTKCKEVRHAWTRDPETKRQLGTKVMRNRCKDGNANKSFALIFYKRTLDMTALSSDQCRILMEGFSALCFRLQYDRLHDDDYCESDSGGQGNNTCRSFVTDDDWASTVYGGESTVSMTHTANSGTNPATPTSSPWGL